METFLFFWLRLRRAYDSAYNYTIFDYHQVISALTIYCEVLKLDQTPVTAKHIFISTVIACFKALFLFRLQTRTQSLFMCFGSERRLGATLRRARVLMGRDEGSYFSFVPSHEIMRAPHPTPQSSLTPKTHKYSDWVRVCSGYKPPRICPSV